MPSLQVRSTTSPPTGGCCVSGSDDTGPGTPCPKPCKHHSRLTIRVARPGARARSRVLAGAWCRPSHHPGKGLRSVSWRRRPFSCQQTMRGGQGLAYGPPAGRESHVCMRAFAARFLRVQPLSIDGSLPASDGPEQSRFVLCGHIKCVRSEGSEGAEAAARRKSEIGRPPGKTAAPAFDRVINHSASRFASAVLTFCSSFIRPHETYDYDPCAGFRGCCRRRRRRSYPGPWAPSSQVSRRF